MKRVFLLATLCMSFAFTQSTATAANHHLDCRNLDKIFNGDVTEKDGVCSVEITRHDINVTQFGHKMAPHAIDLAFQVSFQRINKQTSAMGEFALLEEEVNPVIKELQKGNLDITALHNHMMDEQPRIMFVHFHGLGDMEEQANTIEKAIKKTGHTKGKKH